MPARDPLIGFATDSLRFDHVLGRGGMGAVYRGRQVRLDRPVAIKVIKPDLAADQGYRERFVREAQTMGRLIHPHIVACHDFGPIRGPDGEDLLVMVMEYVDGASLGRMAADERLPVRQALAWYAQAGEALAAAHRLGIIHRDIKPDNIMVTREGVAKLADFGLARATDSIQVTATGALVGSPAYMSPEASLGHELIPASDVYSLACSVFHTLAGRPPFHAASTLQVLHQHIAAPPPDFAAARRDLAPLAPLLARCLAKDPARRPDPAALARELGVLALALPATATTAAPATKPDALPPAEAPATATARTVVVEPVGGLAPGRRRLLVLGAVVVVLLLVVVVAAARKRQEVAPAIMPSVAAEPADPPDADPPPPVPPPAPSPASPAEVLLVAGSGMLGAPLAAGHPAAPVGAPAPADGAPAVVMSQLGKLRLRPPAGADQVLLVLHPGPGTVERRLRLDGAAIELQPGGWQVVRRSLSPGRVEHAIEAASGGPFFCAAAVAGPAPPRWQDLGVQASMLIAPDAAPLRDLMMRRPQAPADFTSTVLVAKPLAARLFGDAARSLIAEAFVQGPAPEGLVVETDALADAARKAVEGGSRWCFILLDAADVPSGALRADAWCAAVEDALRRGTLLVPVLGGLPTPRNQVLWESWIEQVQRRLPGLPILDLAAVRAFHDRNGLPPPDAAAFAGGLAGGLRELRARLAAALRPQP